MIEKIAEQLVSLFVSDVSNYFREQKQYASRVAAITDAINKMLDHEKGNSYFNSVDRVLSNSMLLRNLAYEVKSFRDAEIDERIEAAVARDESIPAADIKRVCEVIKRILIQAHDIITQPTSLQDKLHVAWINDAKNEIKDDVSNAKKELQQQLKQMTDTLQKEVLLTDEQYEAFEHMVVELYLAGHLLAIQEIVLASENWQAYEIPQQLLSLTCFMKMAYQYYDSGLVSSKEVAVYLSLPGTPIIDELFLCLLFLCGNKEEKEMLLAQSEHERWKEYVKLKDADGNVLTVCFYPNADMLPTVESSFAEAKHILADQRNLLYTRLRGRGIGHELVYDGTQYRVVEMGITYGHLCRYCLAELAQHRDVLQLSGTVEKLLDNVTSIVSESVSMGDMLRTEYLKPDNNYIGYRCFANKANESLIAAIDMLVRCSMPLRSVASHDLIQEAEYIIGLDTLYLLAILPLEESERCKLLKRMIMSESTYACYQAEMKEDFDMQLRSGGQFQMIDGKLVIVENNLDDPCAYARTLYDPIIPLAEHIRKESAIFDYPDMCKDTYGRLAEVYGQHVLDNFQLISDSRHVVLNDRSEAYIYQCLNLSQPMCTIMNVLASDDISLGSKVKSFSKLAEIRYVGCISFVFFFSLNQHMKVLQQANEPDIYEAYLSEIISALNTIANNSDAYLGDMYQVIKCFSDMSLLSDAVPSILVEFMLHHIPDSTLESDQLPVDGESK